MVDWSAVSEWSPLLLLIRGAPGSGKTTLGSLIASRLRLQHIDRDFVANGLRLTVQFGGPASLVERAPATAFGVLEHLTAAGVSVVFSGTMYRGEMEQSVRRLQDFATVVNVHLTATNATDRWIAARRQDGVPEAVIEDLLINRIHNLGPAISDAVDYGCTRIEVRADEGYDPSIDAVVDRVLQAASRS